MKTIWPAVVAWAFGALSSLAFAQVVEVVPADLRDCKQPQVVMAPNGNLFVAFGKETAVYCASSTNGGKSFLQPVLVARVPGLALGLRRGPRIVASPDRVTISAISHAEGNLYSWNSSDGGVSWSEATTVNSKPKSAEEGLHSMSSDSRGNAFLVWLDSRNKGKQLWGAGSTDGGKTWSENVSIYASPDGHVCECCHPSVTVLADGTIEAMWRNWLEGARDMYVAVSHDRGKTFGAAKKCGAGTWSLNGCPMDGGGISGQYTTWRRGSSIYFTSSDGEEQLLDTNASQPVVAISGQKTPVFVWQRGTRLMISEGPIVKPKELAENGTFPSLAASAGAGPVVVVYESFTNGSRTILSQIHK